MRVTLNLGDFNCAQAEIPPPQQQLISNVNPRHMEKATGYRVVGGFSVTDCGEEKYVIERCIAIPRFKASRIIENYKPERPHMRSVPSCDAPD